MRKVVLLAVLCCTTSLPQDRDNRDNRDDSGLVQWVSRLVHLESRNNSFLKIVDKNGLFSYGCLQFQQITFVSQVRRHRLAPEPSSDSEIMKRVFDCDLQKDLAVRMIREDWRNYRHWWNSVKIIGRPPKNGR